MTGSLVHEGPAVLPGRYASPAILLHPGPTPQEVVRAEKQVAAEGLAGRICAAAAMETQAECQLLELIGDFDATGAVAHWAEIKSVAHWLSWACGMASGGAAIGADDRRLSVGLRYPDPAAAEAGDELANPGRRDGRYLRPATRRGGRGGHCGDHRAGGPIR